LLAETATAGCILTVTFSGVCAVMTALAIVAVFLFVSLTAVHEH
jgi:hypothetical protein